MDVHSTVEASLRNWPSLHENRTQVLHFLFCVIGNGYDWVDGEIVNSNPEDDEREALDIFAPHQWESVKDSYWRINHLRSISENADLLAEIPGPIELLYPRSSYAKILIMPPDITQDWFNAAVELAHFIKRDIFPRDGFQQNGQKTRMNWVDALQPLY